LKELFYYSLKIIDGNLIVCVLFQRKSYILLFNRFDEQFTLPYS